MAKRIPKSTDEVALKRSFGATIRIYRQRLALSQEELAWRAEMHRTYLADVERGARNLSLSSIFRLVAAIGVSLSEFFAQLERTEAPAPTVNGRRRRAAANRGRTKRRR